MPNAKYLKDAAERVVATFVVAALALVSTAAVPWLSARVAEIATGTFTWQTLLAAAAVAGFIAAWDVAKVLLAKLLGDPESASLIR